MVGRATNGKSDALLMIALQYFDCKGYKGLIFRRSLTDHKLPSSILSRAKEWLAPFLATGEVKWVPGEHTMYSIEGGMLTFGYLDKDGSKERYQSSELHRILYDELTHFKEEEYLYLFSRLRRTAETNYIPLGMRGGTNPGGRGHAWVKKRFKIDRDEDGEFRGHNPLRPFIQAKVRDNPHLDIVQYERQLDKLDPVTRDRLKDGDWSASEAAIFKDDWFEYRWTKKHEYYHLNDPIRGLRVFHQNQIFPFTTVDTAGSERTGIEGKVFYSNQDPSWSVCSVFGMTPDYDLIWLDNFRSQCTIPRFISAICQVHRQWSPSFAISETNSINLGTVQGLRAKGISVIEAFSLPGMDKVVRSTSAQLRAEQKQIWLPTHAEWLPDLEDELFVWTGMKGETDDQIDTLSLAAHYVGQKANGNEQDGSLLGLGSSGMQPRAHGGLWQEPKPLGSRGLFAPKKRRTGART